MYYFLYKKIDYFIEYHIYCTICNYNIMETIKTYKIRNNGSRPYKVTVDDFNKKVFVYKQLDEEEKQYTTHPILEYHYKNIFIGKSFENSKYDGNTILIDLGHNIYVSIKRDISVFKSLYPIDTYFSQVGNNEIPYPYAVDTMGNIYLVIEKIILKEYTKDKCGDPYRTYYSIRDIRSFEYNSNLYDLDGKINYDNVQYHFTHTMKPLSSWKRIKTEYETISYSNSIGNIIPLTQELYCEINDNYSKYRNFEYLKMITVKDTQNNIIKKPTRLSPVMMYIYIKHYLNNNKILIDNYIIRDIIGQYKLYLDILDLLSQCAQAIDFININSQELQLFAIHGYGKAIKYLQNDKLNDELLLMVIKNNPFAIKYINNPSDELCKISVQTCGTSIRFIKKTFDMCMMAVEQNIFSFQYIGDIYYGVTKYVLNKKGRLLKYVKNQTPELCLIAVSNNGEALEFVKNQTEEICWAAIKQDGNAIYFAKEQTYEMCMYAINNGCPLFSIKQPITLEMAMLAVSRKGYNIEHVPPEIITQEMCIIAAQNELYEIDDIPPQFRTQKVYEGIINNWPYIIEDMDEPQEYHWRTAIQKDGRILQNLPNKTYELCLLAVQNKPSALEFVPIEFRTMELLTIAFTKDIKVLRYIDGPTKEVIDLANKINNKAHKYIN